MMVMGVWIARREFEGFQLHNSWLLIAFANHIEAIQFKATDRLPGTTARPKDFNPRYARGLPEANLKAQRIRAKAPARVHGPAN